MRMVIAIGGNALLPKGSKGTAQAQMKAARAALRKLSKLMARHQVALTHGNGPQVGSLLLQQHATRKVPEMPLDVLDAMTQGEIGYFIVNSLPAKSAVILTRAVVEKNDRAFKNPSKPIGPFYNRPLPGKNMIMDSGRGYRVAVPSPMPKYVPEREAILCLMKAGFIVVCGGGGGIPILKDGRGVEAVIDKDNFSSLLASTLSADILIFVTSVDAACIRFGDKKQKEIRSESVQKMEELVEDGQFAEGSMRPKVEAALRFLNKGGKKALICSIANIEKAIAGRAGTTIRRNKNRG